MIAEQISAQSKKIYEHRMAAFASGDEAAVREISEGRDVLSYISKSDIVWPSPVSERNAA